jgi:hypothetical protein
MGTPFRARILEVDRRARSVAFRLPFRFGQVTKAHGRQMAVRALVESEDGRRAGNLAAGLVGPIAASDHDPASGPGDDLPKTLERSGVSYRLTLDGIEQYTDAEQPARLLRARARHPETARLFGAIRIVEQPLERSIVVNARARAGLFFISAEDLTTLAGVSLQQDLALVGLLGLPDVELDRASPEPSRDPRWPEAVGERA